MRGVAAPTRAFLGRQCARPAYEALRTSTALVRTVGADALSTPALSLRGANASLSVPMGDVELSASAEHVRFSDGNARTGFNVDARWSLAPRVYALYTGGVLAFDERSELYWDPEQYSSHSLGMEYRVGDRGPFTLAARVLPGLARTRESPAVADSSLRFPARLVPQLSASGEVRGAPRRGCRALRAYVGTQGAQSLLGARAWRRLVAMSRRRYAVLFIRRGALLIVVGHSGISCQAPGLPLRHRAENRDRDSARFPVLLIVRPSRCCARRSHLWSPRSLESLHAPGQRSSSQPTTRGFDQSAIRRLLELESGVYEVRHRRG